MSRALNNYHGNAFGQFEEFVHSSTDNCKEVILKSLKDCGNIPIKCAKIETNEGYIKLRVKNEKS